MSEDSSYLSKKLIQKPCKVNIWALDLVPQSADLSWPQERPQVRGFNHKKWEEILSGSLRPAGTKVFVFQRGEKERSGSHLHV